MTVCSADPTPVEGTARLAGTSIHPEYAAQLVPAMPGLPRTFHALQRGMRRHGTRAFADFVIQEKPDE